MYCLHLFFIMLFLIPGLASANAGNCSCKGYFPEAAKPDWLGVESITEHAYFTQGSSFCTGLKKLDVERADKSALANLSRMINAHINSVQSSKQASLGYGVTTDSFTEETTIKADLLLKNAHIVDHWLDLKFCTLYAASKVNISDARNALLQKQLQEKSQLLNQVFFVRSNASSVVDTYMHNLLSELGARTTKNINDSQIEITYKIHDIRPITEKLLKLVLSVDIKDTSQGNSIWHSSFKGKGLSFRAKESSHLTQIALTDALDKLTPAMSKVLKNRSLVADGK